MLGDIDATAMAEAGFSVDEGTGAAGLDDDNEPSPLELLGDDDLLSNDDLGGLLGGGDDD